MSETQLDDVDNSENPSRVSRPTLAQVKAVISFMDKHPYLANRSVRVGMGHAKFKKLWVELSDLANSVDGAVKSTKGWIKYWSDKRRSVLIKKKQIDQGKLQGQLTLLEEKIVELSNYKAPVTKKTKQNVKEEPCNGDDNDSFDDENSDVYSHGDNSRLQSETDEQQLNMIDKLVVVMEQQSSAMSQMAQATLNSSKALERLAEASHVQALAADRLAGSFEAISSSCHDIRNAIIGIDFTLKRCYPTTATQQRQNSNIFS